MFTVLNQNHLEALRKIVGDANVLTDPDSIGIASCDETEDLCFPPDVVVRPANAQEISEILKFANEEMIPVTPRGGGTGLSGGALPVFGGIALVMDRFNKILEIDRENFFVITEAGVITEVLQNAVEAVGLFYPPDLASKGSCFIGGNVAENSGGPRAVKYGTTKDWVYGLEVVLPTGEVIKTGGKLLKNVAGYNLTQLFVGSEGTLGVITKAILRLIAKPRFSVVLLASFGSSHDACSAVPKIFHAGVVPAACEFIERDGWQMALKHLGKSVGDDKSDAFLLIEIDGNDEDKLAEELELIGEICNKCGASEVLLGESGARRNELWDIRRAVGEAVKSHSIYKEEDTVVPRARIADLFVGVKNLCTKHGVRSICYGHAGDGNLHVNLLKDTLTDDEWRDKLPPLIVEIFRYAISLGGTVSGEHGIGWSQKEYLPLAVSEVEMNLFKELKRTLDPKGIMNPGKIF